VKDVRFRIGWRVGTEDFVPQKGSTSSTNYPLRLGCSHATQLLVGVGRAILASRAAIVRTADPARRSRLPRTSTVGPSAWLGGAGVSN